MTSPDESAYDALRRLAGQHLIILFPLKVHEVNQEHGTNEESLHAHFQIHGKGDPKAVGICKSLSTESSPLLCDTANLCRFISSKNLEFHIAATADGTHWALDLQYNIS